jgi:hypothetical protein
VITRFIPIWAIVSLALFTVGSVWLRLSIIGSVYEFNQAERLLKNAEKRLETVELNLAKLKSPKNLEKLARTKYGLAAPKPEQIIHLGK